MNRLLLALIFPILSFTARAGTTTFTDGTFNLANYSESPVFTSSSSDTISWTQCSTCGNPGKALQIVNVTQANGAVGVGFVNNNFLYNPSTQGVVIISIDASVDKSLSGNVTFNTFRPLIEQDGTFYLAAISGPPASGYNTISATGLGASDFTQFDFSTFAFGTGHPNFAGDPMLFGLSQLSAQSGGVDNLRVEIDYDNLRLSVHNAPDSGATMPLLFGSVGMILLFARRLWLK